MNWQDIYEKYKDTELMIGFKKWYINECSELQFIESDIRDVYGFLKIYTESKGIVIAVDTSNGTKCLCGWLGGKWTTIANDRDCELGMLWCADKCFGLINA